MYLRTLPSTEHCSICNKTMSIYSTLLTINSLYQLISVLVLSNLLSSQSCSISCFRVSLLIMSPDSNFLHICLTFSPIFTVFTFIFILWCTLSTYGYVQRQKYSGVIPTSYKFKCSCLTFSMEFILLRLSFMSVIIAFKDVCSSSKLKICWICSISLSSFNVG